MSIQLPSAQFQYDELSKFYSTLYETALTQYVELNDVKNHLSANVSHQHTDSSKARLSTSLETEATKLQELIIGEQIIKNVGDLIHQGIAYLNRPALTLTTNPARFDEKLGNTCSRLFTQNIENVKSLHEAEEKFKSLSKDYREKLNNELLPAWEQFVKTFALQKNDNANVENSDSTSATEESSKENVATSTPEGFFNSTTTTVMHLANNIFAMIYTTPTNYNPINYLDKSKVKPLPPHEKYHDFFHSSRRPAPSETSIESITPTEDSCETLSCSLIYRKLMGLSEINYPVFKEKCFNANLLLEHLKQVITQAETLSGTPEALKEKGRELQETLNSIEQRAVHFRAVSEALTLLNFILIRGVDYLALPPISATDEETIKVLHPSLWDSILEGQKKANEQHEGLKEQLTHISDLWMKLEKHNEEIEKKFHEFRYQVRNLSNGYRASLGYKQGWKVTGTVFTNPTDSKLPKPASTEIELLGFNSENLERPKDLSEESYLVAIINRIQSLPEKEGEEKVQSETPTHNDDTASFQDLKTPDELPAQLMSVFIKESEEIDNSSDLIQSSADVSTKGNKPATYSKSDSRRFKRGTPPSPKEVVDID